MKTNLFGRISRCGISITRRHQHISSAALLALFLGLLCSFARGAEGARHTNGPTRQDPARIERRGQREYQQRIFPLEQIPAGARSRALEQIRQAEALKVDSPKAGGGFHWSNIGPSPNHDTTSPDAGGRVSAIAVDPNSASHWLAGAAQGGIWESIDGGATWEPRSDDAPSLAIGSIAFAPSNAKIVYAGTGEAIFSADSYAGMGLLKSLDGGTSWFVVATNFAETAFSEIKIHSSNPNYLVAATARGVLGVVEFGTNIPPAAPSRGIFVSHDGGTNWTHTLVGEATDVEIDRGNFDHQYAALGEILGPPTNGVYRSVNGGTNWIRINGPWSASGAANIGRIEMALAPFTPNRLYVSVAGKRVPGSATDLLGIWRTDNAWDPTPAWTQISTLVSPDPGSFPWYSHDLLVHPANPDVVYFAGITVWRFDGSSWQQLPNQHPDQHKLAWVPTFDPSVFRLLATHDGGISSRYDNFGAWSSHLKGLVITQIYKGAVHPGDSSVILGASQDNGTEVYNGSPGWNIVLGGDGYSCAISTAQPNKYWAASHQNYGATTIYRTQDGKNFSSASFGIDSSTISFFIDFVKHPVSDDIFVAGAINLWRCENFFSATVPEWISNSPVLKTLDGRDAEVSAIAFAPSDVMGRIYAYGTEVGQLRLTTNAGTSWVDIDLGHNSCRTVTSAGWPSRRATRSSFSSHSPALMKVRPPILATFSRQPMPWRRIRFGST